MRFSTSFLAIVASILPAFAAPSPLINVVKAPGGTRGGHVVTFKSEHARLSFASKANNSTLTYHYDIINGVAGKFTDEEIQSLRANPSVEGIYEDCIAKISGIQTNAPWGLARLSSKKKLDNQKADSTNFTYNYNGAGQGVDIYVVDTGISTKHADFGGRAKWGNTFGGYLNDDGNGHGTHCAGTAGSTTYGVAKEANLIAVKVLDDSGNGAYSDVIAGLDYVMRSAKASGRPSVVSLSLGGPPSQPLDDAVTKLVAEGNIPVVVAAGNERVDAGTRSPARAPSAITVAASNIADQQTSFSNYGKAVTLFAPGQDILSTWIGSTSATKILSGTSMATPHVSGLVATFLSVGKYTPAQMKEYLKGKALDGVLSGVSPNTPNKLAQNGLAVN